MESYIVAYDICDKKRLRKVAHTCEDFGFRRQYSVFMCRISARALVQLKSRLYTIIDLDVDQVLFIPVCERCADGIEALGRPVERYDAKDAVIVT
jgi:CRISPR-associated protein Cas2